MPSPRPPGTGSPISGGRPGSASKILTLEALADLVDDLRRSGKTVVQAHGTFDLLHPGHLKHLEAARRHGDVLVVTVTADAFVKKGPDRPVFNHGLRAEMLAALAVVDHVAVDPHADAVAALRLLRPQVYCKGQDYADAAADVTGKITLERQAVEAGGGALVFTDEATFSSTTLLNRHLDPYEPRLRAHLDGLRARDGRAVLLGLLDAIRDLSVLVVGDAIIDEYEWVVPLGKAGKEALVATRHQGRERFAGGALATASHAAAFCRRVELLTCVGDDPPPDAPPGVAVTAMTRAGAPTTRKRRMVDPAGTRKLFEVYHIDDSPLPGPLQRAFDDSLAQRIGDFDVVIANDFGHGLIAASTVELLAARARFLAVNTQTNAANHGYNLVHKYPRADYVCLDAEEARLAAGDRRAPLEHVIGELRLRCDRTIVTRGAQGCLAHRRGEAVEDVPAVTRVAADTLGAGDAFLAVTAPLVAAGGALADAGFLGNIAGALKVSIVGHRRAIERADLIKSVTALLQ